MAFGQADVVVVGAGIIGLTTAVRLAESGLRVEIHACRRGQGTSSFAAGAIFDPYMADHEHLATWAMSTRQVLEILAKDDEIPWARLLTGVEASRAPQSSPFVNLPAGYTECRPKELPQGFAAGWRYQVPLVEMPPYLEWLEQRFKNLKGEIHQRRLQILDDAFNFAEVVVNCTGIGAHDLVHDDGLRPLHGQLVAIQNPGIHEFFVEHALGQDVHGTTYLLPQGEILLLGGSAEKGGFEPIFDPKVADDILARCIEAFPLIVGAKILNHRYGIRPQRGSVRLEHEERDHGHVVHNYGHGGSGVSLSWGCADEVTGMVRQLLRAA